MKKIVLIVTILGLLVACKSNQSVAEGPSNLQEELEQKNRAAIPLIVQIRQKPGIVFKNNVPAIQKGFNSLYTVDQEPLYILDNFIVGNSFTAVDQLVDNFMVKKIEVITGEEASFYGARGANGVIKITTHKGDDKPIEQ